MQFFPNGLVITIKGDFRIMNTTMDIQGIRTIIYPVKDVGGGKLVASVKDADGNIIGRIQLP